MGLSRSVFVKFSKVHHMPRTAICLCCRDHTAAPVHWSVDGDTFYDTELFISIKACFDCRLPMEWNCAWGVDCFRSVIF